MLHLQHGLEFSDLYERHGLQKLDKHFCTWLKNSDTELHARLMAARAAPDTLERSEESALLLSLAPSVEGFIAGLFGVEKEVAGLRVRSDRLESLFACKKQFIHRLAKKKPFTSISDADAETLARKLSVQLGDSWDELDFARHVMHWLENREHFAEELNVAENYALWALHTEAGQARHQEGILFSLPQATDPLNLVQTEKTPFLGVELMHHPQQRLRQRHGFRLTDPGADFTEVQDQAHYCIWCHHQGRDSCHIGFKDRKTGAFRRSHFGVPLTGCPLEEKISEMNQLAARGHMLAALAVVAIDNPLLAATGHRICNDCMKSCIYQKQKPVDIPQIETRVLKETLGLPWGFEIYSLLTRWNPLNLRRPLPKKASGYKVLVAGLGPAGFTLAHHLLNEGHAVVGIDGLKIEPLPAELSGRTASGKKQSFRPVHRIEELYESLDERVMAGFGGVTEYGITVRWNKNFLKVIRLLLERRSDFTMFGGVRLGSTFTFDDAFRKLGFDHIALCLGAGAPTYIPMPNGLARGVRQASDFLMALQLTGAAKIDSLANLQIRLPIVVIGGGLTAIDTATEALAYYPVQVEKFLTRYETLVAERGEAEVRRLWDEEETRIADEFLDHARAIRAERQDAAAAGRKPDILRLLNEWGGSTIVYRRRLIDAPSYTLNHEEISKAMEEGIRFAELLSPEAVEVDAYGHAEFIRLRRMQIDENGKLAAGDTCVTLPARSILIAAGTKPNTVLSEEFPSTLKLHGRYFQALDETGNVVEPEHITKPEQVAVLTHIEEDHKAISFFGDLHPSFAGNVVKAMASATKGFPVVDRILKKRAPDGTDTQKLFDRLQDELTASVAGVERLTPNIVEVTIRAPWAARSFHPGQFYRLQNFESLAPKVDGTTLAMEGIALTGAEVDRNQGLVSLILLEMGGSSDLCALLKPGEPVVLMGPTGHPTEIAGDENVLLIGGGLGNAVLFSIGSAFRQAGSKVLYFAGYKKRIDRYKVKEIEAASDVVVWCCDEAPGFEPDRPQDKSFVGNMIEALLAYGNGELGPTDMPLHEIDRIMVIGSAGLMAAVAEARHSSLKPYLKPDHIGIGSINSPMQCMMKKICAQCLQPHRDPATGKEKEVVFSCFNQDQLLDEVDFSALMQRLRQQTVQEKLARQWIDRCLIHLGVRP